MKNTTTKKHDSYIVDASGKSLGRLASHVALTLQGKLATDFEFNARYDGLIIIKNVDKLNINEKKLTAQSKKSYSGYPGGLKSISWGEAYGKDPKKFFLDVVRHMLPKNKQSRLLIKQVQFE